MRQAAIDEGRIEIANDWWEYYGLAQDPFLAAGQHAFYFARPEGEQYIDLLQLLAHHSYELLLVQGAKGSGKTTLLEQFLERLEPDMPTCRLIGKSNTTVDELIYSLAASFDTKLLEETSSSSIRAKLNELLVAIAEREERCLLIIDNAHQLSSAVIQALLYVQKQRWENQIPLAIILFAEDDFEKQLTQMGELYLEKGMLKQVQITALELQQIDAYLSQRFDAAGNEDELPFSREDILQIHQWSGGIPSRIHEVAREILVENMEQEEFEDDSFWQIHQAKFLSGGLFLIALAIIFLIWQSSEFFSGQQHATQQTTQVASTTAATPNAPSATMMAEQAADNVAASTDTPVTPAPVNQAATTTNKNAVVATNNQAATVTTNTATTTNAPLLNNPNTASTITNDMPVTSAITPATTTTNSQPTPQVQATVEQAAVVASNSLANAHAAQVSNNANTAVTPKPQENSLAASANSPQAVSESQTEMPVTTDVATHEESLPAASTTTTPNTETTARLKKHNRPITPSLKTPAPRGHIPLQKLTSNTSDNNYLLGTSAQEYTIQIIGLSKLGELKKFISTQGLSADAHYYHTHLNGKDWYVLVYGKYPSAAAAHAAIKKLPAGVRAQSPWVRSYASVHVSMEHQKG